MQTTCERFRESLQKHLSNVAQTLLDHNLVEYLYRKKYNIPPNDPRLLDLEYWEMDLDLEMDYLFDKKLKSLQKVCPNCKMKYYGKNCPECGVQKGVKREYYFDPDFDEYVKKIEGTDPFKDVQWEEAPDEEPQ
jgi:hypothetical protein